ncbi:MAG: integrase arm-type DNA-binding domain-containing protein [Planctomycetota bacterium]|jgi:integrase|nr:integrase arm-type DNA-binding domain-containing protein [Planctomycetota bacterium]
MKLSDAFVKRTRGTGQVQKYADGDGLFLHVTPEGKKSWRFAYRFLHKQKLLVMGTYPAVSLREARQKRLEARKLLAHGIDPSEARRTARAAAVEAADNSFERVAMEWLDRRGAACGRKHRETLLRRLRNNVFPQLGRRPLRSVSAPELLAVLRRVESRGAVDMAHRTLSVCGRIFRYAVAAGLADRDVAADLRGALGVAARRNFSALTDPAGIGRLLCDIEDFSGRPSVRLALRLSPLLFVRPGELVGAEWKEFNLEAAEWRIPAARMKMRQIHLVPLSRQALAILAEAAALSGGGKYVFPSPGGKGDTHLTTWSLLAALRRLGYSRAEMTIHGFRAMASTLLNEQGYNRDWIERQLAHGERNGVRAAYNHAEYLPERRKMMQEWADRLDFLRARSRRERDREGQGEKPEGEPPAP